MRWTPLLLAAACTHPQPPPPPLAVSPQAAAEPAPPAPAGGAAAPAPDLVSPITASGVEQPVGLDWGPTGDQPAAQILKNVKVLGALTGNRFMAGMQSMRANL